MKIFFVILVSLFILSGCDFFKGKTDLKNESTSKIKTYYTCSMHPQIRENKPGKCPICHMGLTKVDVEEDATDRQHHEIKMSPSKVVWYCKDYPEETSEVEGVCPIDGTPMLKKEIMNSHAGEVIGKVKLRRSQISHFKADIFPVTKMKMDKKIRLLGTVFQSEDKESNIPARVAGRVEKVYVKSTGSLIKVGDPVVDLYSPKLITAGEEYLITRKSYEKNRSNDFKNLLEQSAERLRLWDVKRSQYEAWYAEGRVPSSITIYSPSTGIVRKRNAIVGKYFMEGQNFFELSDLSEVWIEMDVYEHDSALIELGQKVDIEFTALPGEKTEGVIDFLDPILDSKTRTLKIRTTVKNTTGKIRPGMAADVTLNVTFPSEVLVIPRTSVIDTGKRKVVWVKMDENLYQSKIIETGFETEGYIEIKAGLSENENVVIEGNFLLDAEAQLFGGYDDLNGKDKI